MRKITKRSVESAPIKGADYIIWDDDLSGFGVRIFASGRTQLAHQMMAATMRTAEWKMSARLS
jgi:hypothetical protein